jgi:hypothetical protein
MDEQWFKKVLLRNAPEPEFAPRQLKSENSDMTHGLILSLFMIIEKYHKCYMFSASCWLQPSEIMGIKTLSDCKQCLHLIDCDAHISNGTHKHMDQPNPCELVLKTKECGLHSKKIFDR